MTLHNDNSINGRLTISAYCIPQPETWSWDGSSIMADKSGVYQVYEESGTLWVWAFPDLLGWPADIAWLFPRVSNDGPGDLWGIDATGDLLIMETKSSTPKKRLEDPFQDFANLDFLQDKNLFKADRLQRIWEELYDQELAWIRSGCQKPDGAAPGVIPYSSHRGTISLWITLWREKLLPFLEGVQYPATVRDFLRRRKERVDPPPHFFGLYTVTHSKRPGLSQPGSKHFRELAKHVGVGRIHQRALRCLKLENGIAKIESVDVEPCPMIGVDWKSE